MSRPPKRKWAQFTPSTPGARIFTNQLPNSIDGPYVELRPEDEARLAGTSPSTWTLRGTSIEAGGETVKIKVSPTWRTLLLGVAIGAALTGLTLWFL